MILHLIRIKGWRVNMDYPASMENDQNDADHFVRKAEEFRDKARVTLDPRVKSALEAAAREFIRKARHFDANARRLTGIQ